MAAAKKKKPGKAKKLSIDENAGQRLRARRVALGLSQEAVGHAVGMASQQVQKYEKGVNAMSAKRLHDFATCLKVPVGYFFEGTQGKAVTADWAAGAGAHAASDRESLEVLKSFKRIKDYALRKRIADMLRSLSVKDI